MHTFNEIKQCKTYDDLLALTYKYKYKKGWAYFKAIELKIHIPIRYNFSDRIYDEPRGRSDNNDYYNSEDCEYMGGFDDKLF